MRLIIQDHNDVAFSTLYEIDHSMLMDERHFMALVDWILAADWVQGL